MDETMFVVSKDGVLIKNLCSSSEITVPSYVKEIGEYAFAFCENLSKIILPESVTTISAGAFEYCSKISSVIIPNSVTFIGEGAFFRCGCLETVIIPSSVTAIMEWAFSCCESLSNINVDLNNGHYYSINGVLFNKETHALVCFPNNHCSRYVIPNGTRAIQMGAFYKCNKLLNITIPYTVSKIGPYAFDGCKNLKKIEVDRENKKFSSECGVLYNKDKDILIAFPNGKKTIYTLPKSIVLVESVFCDCGWLTRINVSRQNKHYRLFNGAIFNINGGVLVAFLGHNHCYDIPLGVHTIGEGAFECSPNLTHITIPSTVTVIKEWAFEDCCSLENIVLPHSVISVEGNSFRGCSSFTKIIIPTSVVSIGEKAFLNCKNLMSIILSDRLDTITAYTFFKCINLTSLVVPNSVTRIEKYAFAFCSRLISISIPSNVNYISKKAFAFCDNVTIKCQRNSYAYQYAISLKIKFELL